MGRKPLPPDKMPYHLILYEDYIMTPQEFKNWRKDMGFTQKQAAARLGVTSLSIENWERGIRRDGKPAPISLAVAYACTAIYHRLKPWGKQE